MPALIALALLLAACAMPKKEIEEVLAPGAGGLQAEANRKARQARQRARQEPGSAALLTDAARALFQAADIEIRRGVLASLDAKPARSIDDLLAREDQLDDSIKARVIALADAGSELAAQAIGIDPESAGARLYYAVNLALSAWGHGVARSLLRGLGPKVRAAFEAAVATDENFLDLAPLRAQAGFLGRAPWPLRDRPRALKLMRRAVKRAPTAINQLYFAEMAWRAGDHPTARQAWQAAVTAGSDPATGRNLELVREFARRAVALGQG